MTRAPRSVARNAVLAAATGATLPALCYAVMQVASRDARPSAHTGDWSALIYLYLFAGLYLIAFLLHPVFLRARGFAQSFVIGAAFGAGAAIAVTVCAALEGEFRTGYDAGDLAETGLVALSIVVAHGLLALPLAGLVRLVAGAPEPATATSESGAPLSRAAVGVLALALALVATGVLMLALFATGIQRLNWTTWTLAAAPFVFALVVGSFRLRERLVPSRRALWFGACFGGWIALLFCGWYVIETQPRQLEDWLVPALFAIVVPAACAGLAALIARRPGPVGQA